MEIEKVCVRIPANRKAELLALAKEWRSIAVEAGHRAPGWDSQLVHQIAAEEFGGLREMFEHHGWPERGRDMLPSVQRHVKETYGSIDAFEARIRERGAR